MDTFGDRLKSERKDRGLSIQAVAEILRVDQDLLRALERNDFDALPGDVIMMDCLHEYAKCLQVDAGLMIEDYVRERDKRPRRLDDVEQVAETGPAVVPDKAERWRFSPWLVALVVVAIAVLAVWWMLSRDGNAPTPKTPVVTAPVEPQPLSSKTPAGVPPTPVEPPAAPAARATSAPLLLSITEYGVGTSVENRQLVGQSDRFTEGTQVWFWTRVQGGTRSHKIDHVWLREGVEAMRISLQIGGSSWRTYSTKTLHAGVAGDWVVEARDDAGRVLARSEFVCVP